MNWDKHTWMKGSWLLSKVTSKQIKDLLLCLKHNPYLSGFCHKSCLCTWKHTSVLNHLWGCQHEGKPERGGGKKSERKPIFILHCSFFGHQKQSLEGMESPKQLGVDTPSHSSRPELLWTLHPMTVKNVPRLQTLSVWDDRILQRYFWSSTSATPESINTHLSIKPPLKWLRRSKKKYQDKSFKLPVISP